MQSVLVALALISALLVVSCQHKAPASGGAAHRIVWPPPPAPPRILHESSFGVPEELGIKRVWIAKLFSYLAGGRRQVEMIRPYAVAVDPAGRIAVADPDARCLHLYDQSKSRYSRFLEAGETPFASPVGVAADPNGVIYVSDSFHRKIFRLSGRKDWLEPIGGDGELQRPTGIAFDPALNRLYVVDTVAHRLAAYGPDGRLIRTFGGRGNGSGQFNYPVAVAVGPDSRLYVTDSMNFRVQILQPDGTFVRAFGRAGSAPGDLDKAKGIAVNSDGHIFVVEGLHDVVHVYNGQGRLLTVIGGTGTGQGEFWLPAGIFIDSTDRILVADSANRRVQILQYLRESAAAGSM